jgi:hypothetical protein
MPQLDFDGANSKVSADKIQGQSGTTVTVPTGHKIAGTDANSITINGVNAVAVAPSTSGNVLTSTGSAWASSAAAGGAWNLLTTTTASNSASVAFEANIDSTYQNYVVIGSAIVTVSDGNNLYVATGTGATPTYATSYDYHISMPTSNAHTYAGLGFNASASPIVLHGVGNASGEGGGFVLYMYNPSGTTMDTVLSSTGTCHDETSYAKQNTMAMVYPATTAVTAIKFTFATGNISSGVFKLYGIN